MFLCFMLCARSLLESFVLGVHDKRHSSIGKRRTKPYNKESHKVSQPVDFTNFGFTGVLNFDPQSCIKFFGFPPAI